MSIDLLSRIFLNADTGASDGATTVADTAAVAAETPAASPGLVFGDAERAAVQKFVASQDPEGTVTAKEEVDEEVAEEKVEEKAEEPKADDKSTDKPAKPWLDEDTTYLAQEAGISREDAAQYSSRKDLVKAIALANRLRAEKSAAPAGDTAKKAGDKPGKGEVESQPEGIDLSQFDEDTAKVFKAQQEELKVLKENLGRVTQAEQQREFVAFRDQFDATIRQFDPELFGKDSHEKTPRDLMERREKVLAKVIPDYVAAKQAGQEPDLKALVEGYSRFFFGKEMEERKTKVMHKRAEEKSQRRLATPTRPRPAGNTHPSQNPELIARWASYKTAE